MINLFALIFLLLFCSCSSSLLNFHSPVVKKGGEIQGSLIYSVTGSVEMKTIVGLGYNSDISLQLSPLFPISVFDGKLSYPVNIDIHYQLLTSPIFISTGIGWSNYISRQNEANNRIRDHSNSNRISIIAGYDFLYGGIQENFIYTRNSFTGGDIKEYTLTPKKWFTNYIIGMSIGKALRFNPEVSVVPSKGVLRTVYGFGIEYTGNFLHK